MNIEEGKQNKIIIKKVFLIFFLLVVAILGFLVGIELINFFTKI